MINLLTFNKLAEQRSNLCKSNPVYMGYSIDRVSFTSRLNNTNSRYMFAFDLDGTLAEGDKNDIKKVIKSTKDQNGILVYATGRGLDKFMELKLYLKEKGIHLPLPDYLVSNNGQFIHKNIKGKLVLDKVWEKSLNTKSFDRNKVIDIVRKLGQTDKYRFSDDYLKEKLTNFEEYKKRDPHFYNSKLSYYEFHPSTHNVEFLTTPDLPKLDEDIQSYLSQENINAKVIHYYFPKYKIDKCNDDIQTKSIPLRVDDSISQHAILICPANKGDALEYLRKNLNLEKDHVIASGDEGNDISMATRGYQFILLKNADKLLRTAITLKDKVIEASSAGAKGIAEGLNKIFSGKN